MYPARSPIRHPYKLKGHTLKTEDSTKYPGVDLQTTLSWKMHIDRISKKANSMLGFLRRNLRSCSQDTKANAYFSMVRTNLEYCSSVWNPHQKELIMKLEMIQRRAGRYTTNRYRNTSSVSETPAACHPCLSTYSGSLLNPGASRYSSPDTLLYKVVSDLVDIPADEEVQTVPYIYRFL